MQRTRDAALLVDQHDCAGDGVRARLRAGAAAAAQRAVGEADEQRAIAVGQPVVGHLASSASATWRRARNSRLMTVPVRVCSERAASL